MELTAGQVAKIIGTTGQTINLWAAAGKIPGAKNIANGKKRHIWRFDSAEIRKWKKEVLDANPKRTRVIKHPVPTLFSDQFKSLHRKLDKLNEQVDKLCEAWGVK